MTTNAPAPAYILAGGRSRRFGSDKALADRGGEPAIVRLRRDLLAAGAPDVTAVARHPGAYAPQGVRTIADLRAGTGPLAGLEAALSDALVRHDADWVLLASCDLLARPASWIDPLWDAAEGGRTAAAFRSDPSGSDPSGAGPRWQPFPGLYHTALLPAVRRLLDDPAAKRSYQALLTAVGARAAARPPDVPPPASFNTPAELAASDGATAPEAAGAPVSPA